MKPAAFTLACCVALAGAPALAKERDAKPAAAQTVSAKQVAARFGAAKQAEAQPKAAAQPVAGQHLKPQKVAVAQFDGPSNSHARAAVLAELSDHDDVDVASLDDITFASRRLKVDPSSPDGRKKISSELGVEAWIDGRVDDDSAHLTLTKADGTSLAVADVKAPTPKLLGALTGERMWSAMGPYLSPHEGLRRKLLAENERARQKLELREREAEHQRQLAQRAAEETRNLAKQAEQQHQQKLEAARVLAKQKRAAVEAALARQVTLVRERKAEQVAERKRTEEARRAQLAAAQSAGQQPQQPIAAQSAGQQPAAAMPAGPPQETGDYAPPPNSTYAQSAPPPPQQMAGYAQGPYPAQPGQWARNNNARPIAGWNTPAGGAPVGPNGVSAATQRWLMQQQQYFPPQQQAPGYAPAQPMNYAANGGAPPAPQQWQTQPQR